MFWERARIRNRLRHVVQLTTARTVLGISTFQSLFEPYYHMYGVNSGINFSFFLGLSGLVIDTCFVALPLVLRGNENLFFSVGRDLRWVLSCELVVSGARREMPQDGPLTGP